MENEQTQLDKANQALVNLVPNITANDRKEAGNEYAESTIVEYLKGRGRKLDTAVALLNFFRQRIEDRDKQIA